MGYGGKSRPPAPKKQAQRGDSGVRVLRGREWRSQGEVQGCRHPAGSNEDTPGASDTQGKARQKKIAGSRHQGHPLDKDGQHKGQRQAAGTRTAEQAAERDQEAPDTQAAEQARAA